MILRRTSLVALLVALGAGCGRSRILPVPPVAALPAAPESRATAKARFDPAGEWDVRWDRGFAGWQPTLFAGKLTIDHADPGPWKATIAFVESSAQPSFESLRLDGDEMALVFRSPTEQGVQPLEMHFWIRGDRLSGEARWGDLVPWTPIGGHRHVGPQALKKGTASHSLPPADATSTGASPDAFATILEHSRAEHSTALVLVKDGRILLEDYGEGYDGEEPLEAMSGSKSFVSLAVGLLIADKKLSLDTTMGSLFQEWKKQGAKGAITVRQLLTHTSGLDPERADFDKETIREHALKAKLVFAPGTRFQYNNSAVDFLASVVRQAAGMPLDEFLEQRIFRKLDVVGAHWSKDSAGDPRGAGELFIRPVDFAKIGQLVLDGGKWHGEQIVPAEWIARSTAAGQSFDESCGMLWWRRGKYLDTVNDAMIAVWRDAGLDDEALRAARTLLGKKYRGFDEYRAALATTLGPTAVQQIDGSAAKGNHVPRSGKVADGPVNAFAAEGWLGQQLFVFPQSRVVAVRMRAPEESDYADMAAERNAYYAFPVDVAKVYAP